MRRTALAAGVAAMALVAATAPGIAREAAAPAVTATAKVLPSKAGTKLKPKPVTLKLRVADTSDSGATARTIRVVVPKAMRISAEGLGRCKLSLEVLRANPGLCSDWFVGTGSAHVLAGVGSPAQTLVTFEVTPVITSFSTVTFVLESNAGNYLLPGKIDGREMLIKIPPELQQPAPGLYVAFLDFSSSLFARKGARSLVSAIGCAEGAHKIKVKVGYAATPASPLATSASDVAKALCSKAG